MPTITGTITDPEFRRERARRAAYASHSPKAAARKLVASWPDLTAEQKAELRALLGPALIPAAPAPTQPARRR